MLLPALISGQSDYKNGELSKDDQVSITETVREIFYDVVAPFEKEQREESAPAENRNTHVLVLECPFNDDIDDLIVEMLKNTSDTNQWTTKTLKNSHLDGIPQPDEGEPSVILLATSAKKNLARLRAVCRMVRKRCPDARVVIGCWGLEDEIDAIRPRLKDAGAAAVCTTILEARGFIERSEIPVAQPVPPRASYALTSTRHAQN
jgi:hypothetical protein